MTNHLQNPPDERPREVSFNGNVRLRYINISKYGKGWHSILHTHSCAELFYCLRGSGKFRFSDRMLPVRDDDLVMVNPNVEHTELSLKDNPLEYIVLGVDGLEFDLHGQTDNRYFDANVRENRSTLLFYLYALLHEQNSKSFGFERVCQDLLEVLLIFLMRGFNLSFSFTEPHHVSQECAAVKRYLDRNYHEPVTLQHLAGMVHLSKFYLIHTFHNEYGTSPMSYLAARRIQESKYLLTNTNYPLTQIARIVGFSSPSYFSQSFRRSESQSPMEYRQTKQAAGEMAPPPTEPEE